MEYMHRLTPLTPLTQSIRVSSTPFRAISFAANDANNRLTRLDQPLQVLCYDGTFNPNGA